MRAALKATAVACFLLTAGPTASPASDDVANGAQFRGIRLGMSETDALSHVDHIAPGAFVGPLCAGNQGVGSYLQHHGLSWQVMAHVNAGRVDQIKLYRFDRTDTESNARCEAQFRKLLGERRKLVPGAKWQEAVEVGGRYSIKGRALATLPDATTIQISVERLDWDQARCLIEMLISSPKSD